MSFLVPFFKERETQSNATFDVDEEEEMETALSPNDEANNENGEVGEGNQGTHMNTEKNVNQKATGIQKETSSLHLLQKPKRNAQTESASSLVMKYLLANNNETIRNNVTSPQQNADPIDAFFLWISCNRQKVFPFISAYG